MTDDFWVDALVAIVEALERAFGPAPTRFEFDDGRVLEFQAGDEEADP